MFESSMIQALGAEASNNLGYGDILPKGDEQDKLGDILKKWPQDLKRNLMDTFNPVNWFKPGNFSVRISGGKGGGFAFNPSSGVSPELMQMFRELMGGMGKQGSSVETSGSPQTPTLRQAPELLPQSPGPMMPTSALVSPATSQPSDLYGGAMADFLRPGSGVLGGSPEFLGWSPRRQY